MRKLNLWVISLILFTGLFFAGIEKSECAQSLTIEQIQANLLANPPNTGDPDIREESIMALDAMLKDDASRTSPGIFDYYTSMMEKVNEEMKEDVSEEICIWMMYNHGFVVKTPETVFAFDLVTGYTGWNTQLPAELIDQIQVIFITHMHGDHYEADVPRAVKANGGYIVVPSRNIWAGNVGMADGDTATVSGLHVKAYEGHHSTTVMMYEVTCPDGLRIFHAGDNDDPLPELESLDVLLLNAWILDGYEPGTETAGMRNCIERVKPRVMIPGHIQELNHGYDPSSYGSRVPYESAFKVDDVPVASEVQVMAWGERFFISPATVTSVGSAENRSIPDNFELYQNYPNPFNPSTTLQYELKSPSSVTLAIYNILGQKVRTLVNKSQPAGSYEVRWDAASDEGIPVPSGIYFYRLRAGAFGRTHKMLLLR